MMLNTNTGLPSIFTGWSGGVWVRAASSCSGSQRISWIRGMMDQWCPSYSMLATEIMPEARSSGVGFGPKGKGRASIWAGVRERRRRFSARPIGLGMAARPVFCQWSFMTRSWSFRLGTQALGGSAVGGVGPVSIMSVKLNAKTLLHEVRHGLEAGCYVFGVTVDNVDQGLNGAFIVAHGKSFAVIRGL